MLRGWQHRKWVWLDCWNSLLCNSSWNPIHGFIRRPTLLILYSVELIKKAYYNLLLIKVQTSNQVAVAGPSDNQKSVNNVESKSGGNLFRAYCIMDEALVISYRPQAPPSSTKPNQRRLWHPDLSVTNTRVLTVFWVFTASQRRLAFSPTPWQHSGKSHQLVEFSANWRGSNDRLLQLLTHRGERAAVRCWGWEDQMWRRCIY